MSPPQTPQGSPSKSHAPPGAFDLPHVFDNAMRLLPTFGSSATSKSGSPTSPSKANLPQGSDNSDYAPQDSPAAGSSGSPVRKSNKENTPPGARLGLAKEAGFVTHAAQSRQEPYRAREAEQQSSRYYPGPQRLSAEELEKARKPSVKRLANVTQLCGWSPFRRRACPQLLLLTTPADFLDYYYDLLTYVHTRQNRLNHFKAQNPAPPATPDAEYNEALGQYLGRERANLRDRKSVV